MRPIYTFILNLLVVASFAQNPFDCVENAYLFQFNDIYAVNLASGSAYLVKENIVSGKINAAGYNPADGFIWGALDSPDSHIIRIGEDFNYDTYEIAGLPTSNPYIGDISADGVYYLKPGGTTVYKVDVNPASSTYLELLGTEELSSGLSIHDWAFNAADDMLYTVEKGTNVLYRINPADGTATNLGVVPILLSLIHI